MPPRVVHPSRCTPLLAGFGVACLSMIVAAVVEIVRLQVVADNNLQNSDPTAPGAPVVPMVGAVTGRRLALFAPDVGCSRDVLLQPCPAKGQPHEAATDCAADVPPRWKLLDGSCSLAALMRLPLLPHVCRAYGGKSRSTC